MISETPPDKNSDSYSDKSDKPMNQLENININQLKKILESSVEQIAKLIVTKNWVSLLLLFDTVWILFFFPGGIVAKVLESTFEIEFPKQYPALFWLVVVTIFLIALVIAVRTIQRKPLALPDFTERKAIKGLRAFQSG